MVQLRVITVKKMIKHLLYNRSRRQNILTIIGVMLTFTSAGQVPASVKTPVSLPHTRKDISFSIKKTAVVWFGDRAEATVYWEYHEPADKWRIEYIAPTRAKGRILVQRRSTIWQWEPNRKKIFVTSGDPPVDDFVTIQPLILQNYRVDVVSTDKIEGSRHCRLLKMTPRCANRSLWMLWEDKETGIILKRERSSPHGELEMVSQTLEFHPGAIDAGKFDPKQLPHGQIVNRTVSRKNLSHDKIKDLTGMLPPTHLPGGFCLHSTSLTDHPDVVHITYSDGIAVLSLFTSKGSTPNPVDHDRGRTIQFGNREAFVSSFGPFCSIGWSKGQFRYTLVGSVSERVLIESAKPFSRI